MVHSASRGRLAYGGPACFLNMLKTRQIIAIVTGGRWASLLVVRGAWGGVWPPSIQLLAGMLLVVVAGLALALAELTFEG